MQWRVQGSGDALSEDVSDSRLLRGSQRRLGVVHCQRQAHAKIGSVGAGRIRGVAILYLRSNTSFLYCDTRIENPSL